MKINAANSPLFQKKLIATAIIGAKDSPRPVKIFHMDKLEDFEEMEQKLQNKNWSYNHYAAFILNDFKRNFGSSKYLVMENENGDIISYSNIITKYSKKKKKMRVEICYLESAPVFTKKTDNDREYKYAGETMVACIVNMAKKIKNSYIELVYRDDCDVKRFYKKQCKFIIPPFSAIATLPSYRYDRMLNSNARNIDNSLNMYI